MNAKFPFRRAFFLAAFAAMTVVGCDAASDSRTPPETQERDALIQQVYDLRQENADLKNEIVVLNAEIGRMKHESDTESKHHAWFTGVIVVFGIGFMLIAFIGGLSLGSRIKDRVLADEAAAKDGTK